MQEPDRSATSAGDIAVSLTGVDKTSWRRAPRVWSHMPTYSTVSCVRLAWEA